jgi:uncharacterized membrane protein YtjA (UPF0391 family)
MMLRASITFFLIAILAYVFGANSIAGVSMEIGKLTFLIFVGLAIVSYLFSITRGQKTKI